MYVISAGVESLRIPLAACSSIWKNFGLGSRISIIKKHPPAEKGLRLYFQNKQFPGLFRRVLIVNSNEVSQFSPVWGYTRSGEEDIFVFANRLYDPVEDLFLNRVYRGVAYLLGISVGLEPCKGDKCVMGESKIAEDLDRKGFNLCGECRAKALEIIRDVTF